MYGKSAKSILLKWFFRDIFASFYFLVMNSTLKCAYGWRGFLVIFSEFLDRRCLSFRRHIWKFHYCSAPYRLLLANPSTYVCAVPWGESLCKVWWLLTYGIFQEMQKTWFSSPTNCHLADELRTVYPCSTPAMVHWVAVQSLVTISWKLWAGGWLPIFSHAVWLGVKCFFGMRMHHIAPKSLKRSRYTLLEELLHTWRDRSRHSGYV